MNDSPAELFKSFEDKLDSDDELKLDELTLLVQGVGLKFSPGQAPQICNF